MPHFPAFGKRPALALVTICAVLACAACGKDTSHATGAPQGGVADVADVGPTPDATGDAEVPGDAELLDLDGELSDAALPAEVPPQPWSVRSRGPYGVAYLNVPNGVRYTPRHTDQERTLRLAFWYPTRATSGPMARYRNLLNRPGILSNVTVGVDTPMPVLVFSHGNSGLAEQSYYMCEFFASHGWLVVAADHTGNTFVDGGIRVESAIVRSQDISAILDRLGDLPEGNPVRGLASEDIVLAGHSFGGFTTLASTGAAFAVDALVEDCEQGVIEGRFCSLFGPDQIEVFRQGFLDPRIKVAIPQTPAGAQVFRDSIATIGVPTLLMTAGTDRTLPNEEEGDPIWHWLAQAPGPHRRLDIHRAGHFTYSNFCDLFGTVEQVRNDGCSEEFVPPVKAYALINAMSLAFARHHLWGDDSELELLEGRSEAFDFPWQLEKAAPRP